MNLKVSRSAFTSFEVPARSLVLLRKSLANCGMRVGMLTTCVEPHCSLDMRRAVAHGYPYCLRHCGGSDSRLAAPSADVDRQGCGVRPDPEVSRTQLMDAIPVRLGQESAAG